MRGATACAAGAYGTFVMCVCLRIISNDTLANRSQLAHRRQLIHRSQLAHMLDSWLTGDS